MGCTSSQHSDAHDEEIYVTNDELGDAGVAVVVSRIGPVTRLVDLQHNNIGADGLARLVRKLLRTPRLKLKTLRIGDNPIGARGATEVAKLLAKAPALLELHMRDCEISDAGAKALLEGVSSCESLKVVDLGGNSISREVAQQYAGLLAARPGLVLRHERVGNERAYALAHAIEEGTCDAETMALPDATIADDGAVVLATALAGCTTLRSLELPRNRIGDEGMAALRQALESCTNLTKINMGINALSRRGVAEFARLLHANTAITDLDVSGNPGSRELGNARRDDIQAFLEFNKSVAPTASPSMATPGATPGQEHRVVVSSRQGPRSAGDEEAAEVARHIHVGQPDLTMRHAQLSDYGVVKLANALTLMPSTVTHILLESNRFGDAGAAALGEAIRDSMVTTINLAGNCIGDAGAASLGVGVAECGTLKKLILAKNFLRTPEAFCEYCSRSKSLEFLELDHNGIGPRGAKCLGALIGANRSLQTFKASYNLVGDDGAVAIGEGLATSPSMTRITLADNGICKAGLIGLAKGISACRTLRVVEIERNDLEDDGVIALSEAVAKSKTLHSLDLHQTSFSDSGAHALSTALQSNPLLTNLRIPWDGLSRVVREDIRTTMLMNATENPDIPARW